MEKLNEGTQKRNINDFNRILRQLQNQGIYIFERSDVKFLLEEIQKKVPKKDLYLMDNKSLDYTSISAYLSSYESTHPSTAICITDNAISEIVKAIDYLCDNQSIFCESDLAIIMLVQILRIHCVAINSKDFTTSKRKFTVIVGSNEYWKSIGYRGAKKVREYKFVSRDY